MKLLVASLKLLNELVIGDCWQIAAAMAIVLAGGVALLRLNLVPAVVLVICIAVIILTVAPLIVVLDARADVRRNHEKATRGS